MDLLPMVSASCSLDDFELGEQGARYRAAGRGALIVERCPRKLVIRVSDQVQDEVVEELIAVERGCCPFFDLNWDEAERRLAIAVPDAAHESALEAIVSALALRA